ncbi:MAG: SLBB domain-containing protein [bacterium]
MPLRLEKLRASILGLVLLFCTPVILMSQESTKDVTYPRRYYLGSQANPKDDVRPKTGAQYYLGSADELLMKVNIWGFVRNPGQYLVPTDTDLISLISFSGGPIEDAKMKNIKVIRAGGHDGHGKNVKVIKVNVEQYINTGDESLIPALLPDDTIVVSGSTIHFIGKFFDFAAKLAVIAQIYFWVQIANN